MIYKMIVSVNNDVIMIEREAESFKAASDILAKISGDVKLISVTRIVTETVKSTGGF